MRKCLIGLLAAVSLSSMAASTGKINLDNVRLQVNGSAPARVFIYDVKVTGTNCSRNDIPVILFDEANGHLLGEEMYSTLLSAKMAGKQVDITTNGCWHNGTYPIVGSVYVF
ncbi:hypothetical protein [Pleionea sp. CnH1-48]|uniref:hypothetical protein n=1 Tax=Pleionea sp. CnH1-48 TaxID=2954494 RepID=UPI00209697CA|nr:hypothetical protein [Pleionea sp. CnH1-48]MCO7224250.1 hypothetical protein [Pleionea sp. CnH1-48]